MSWAEIDLGAIRSNVAGIRGLLPPDTMLMAVVKANAYGHGLKEVACRIGPLADSIGVAVLEEGIYLREAGVQTPILVLGGIWGNQIPAYIEHNLTLTAPSVERLEQIEDERRDLLEKARQQAEQEVKLVQDELRDVRRSLGKPKANLTRLPGAEPRAIVTIAWDIVWYQYLVDMRRDLPSSTERVTLHREGMDLDELAFYFKEKNAVVNDDGRLDASELEVRLLSDPDALITEMTPEELHGLEDATEEIWDQRIAPEFKWDD